MPSLPEEPGDSAREFQAMVNEESRAARASLSRIDAQLDELKRRSRARTSAAAWVGIGLLSGAIAITWFAAATEFHLSEAWLVPSLGISALVGGALSGLMLAMMRSCLPRGTGLIVATLVPIFAIAFAWFALARAVPDVFTRLAGQPFDLALAGRTQKICGRGCQYFAVMPVFANGKTELVRIDSREYSSLPAEGIYRLTGRKSWFGLHLDRVDPAGSTP
jgi:hypothetical protein